MKTRLYQLLLVFYLMTITSSEIEFIAVRLPLKVSVSLELNRTFILRFEYFDDQNIHRKCNGFLGNVLKTIPSRFKMSLLSV